MRNYRREKKEREEDWCGVWRTLRQDETKDHPGFHRMPRTFFISVSAFLSSSFLESRQRLGLLC